MVEALNCRRQRVRGDGDGEEEEGSRAELTNQPTCLLVKCAVRGQEEVDEEKRKGGEERETGTKRGTAKIKQVEKTPFSKAVP